VGARADPQFLTYRKFTMLMAIFRCRGYWREDGGIPPKNFTAIDSLSSADDPLVVLVL